VIYIEPIKLARLKENWAWRNITFFGWAVTFHNEYCFKNVVKIMEHVKNAASLLSIIVNKKRNVLIE
jgi:hypothetical protein